MKHDSGDEQALVKIQHDWAEARLKRDNSFPKRIEADDATFTEFNIDDLKVRLFGDTAIVVGQGSIKAHTKTQDLSGQYVWTDTFVKMRGEWKAVASQVTPVLEK